MFNYYTKKLESLTNTSRYKESDFIIQIVNGCYALKEKDSDNYVDLRATRYRWSLGKKYFKDCLGSKRQVINAFNDVCPKISTICISKEY